MEEYKENDVCENAEASSLQGGDSSSATTVQNAPKKIRKNGRNSGHRHSTVKFERVSCGEISDFKDFSEKLSGSNVKGYSEVSKKEVVESAKNEENPSEAEKSEQPAEEAVETAEKPEREGPLFEVSKPQNKVFDTPLVDKRGKNFNSDKNREKGVVSYSSEAEAKKSGIFSKIMGMVSSLFGGSGKENRDRKKRDFKGNNNGGKNWKNDRKFYGDKNSRRKGGYNNNHRHHRNDRKPEGGRGRGGPKAGKAQ